ncbi:MAG: energy transducer TonB, partial [Planctomycetota bacterium]
AQVHPVELPEPPPAARPAPATPPVHRPAPPPKPSADLIARVRPTALPPPPLQPTTLHAAPAAAPIDPLLQGLTLSPGFGAGPALAVTPGASALGAPSPGGTPSLLSQARTLDALAALYDADAPRRPPIEANRRPRWLNRVEPEYPADAMRSGHEGTVTLRLRVDVNGRVVEAEVLDALSGFGFAQAAVDAARQSTFIPGTDATGAPIEEWVKVSYVFQLK